MDPTQDRSEIAFFDLETTFPTEHGQCSILEFGAILVCPKKFEELRSYSTLVRPADPSLISTLSARRNGITPDAVFSAPTFADIADTVFDILHGRIWAGHNILGFDCERIIEAFAEIGRPAPEPKGTIDSLPLLTQRFGRRAGDMKMASLATYFGLGQQTHRSLDDVRMNLEVLKHCATVLFLESSLPESNVKSSPEGTSQNLSTPSSKFKFENASHASPPDHGKEEIHQRFSLVTQGSGDLDSVVVTTADQPVPFDMIQLSNQMETEEIELYCSRLKIRFGISTKFVDQAGWPRLNFVVDTSQSLRTVLYTCEVVAKKLVEDYGSKSKWMPIMTRKSGYFNPPTIKLHIPTEVFEDVAKYGTEMYQKEASGNIQKLVFLKYDPAELDSLLKPGTFVDALLSVDPYDYQQRAGIRLVAKKLIIHSE